MNSPLVLPRAVSELVARDVIGISSRDVIETKAVKTPSTLFEVLELQAARHANKVVFRFLDRSGAEEASLTYGALLDRANEMSRALIADGLGNQPIVLGHETGPEFAVALFAVMAAGGTAIPLATRVLTRPSAALESLLATAQPAAILMDKDIAARRAPTHLPRLWSEPTVGVTQSASKDPTPEPNPIAVIQFTSGSTSDPKGVCISHENFLANAGAICRSHGLTDTDVAVSWLPLFHDMGLMLGMVWPVVAGASTVLMRPSSFVSQPALWMQAMFRYGASVSSSPNFGYQACLDRISDDDIAGIDLGVWKTAISGAEPIRADTVERFIARFSEYGLSPRALVPAFGLAEATVFVSGGPVQDRPRILTLDEATLQREGRASVIPTGSKEAAGPSKARRVVSCGRPADNIEVAIVDLDGPRVLADGGVGEIWVAGPSVAKGYFGAEAATHETFHGTAPGLQGNYLRTGDLGFLLDGELYVAGRLKDIIIVRGTKHHPPDIEATVRLVHSVLATSECAAFATGEGAEEVVVVAELPSHVADMAALADRVRQAVSRAHDLHLHAVCFVGKLRLPRTTSGKIRRHETRRLWETNALKTLASFATDDVEAVPHLGPSSTLARICEIWRAMLGADHVDPDANFFEMGGDSIRLAAALTQLQEIADAPIGLADLFEHPNARALSAFIQSGVKSGGVAAAQERGRRRRAMLGKNAADGIAIVGMAGRFPGAPDLAAFWTNLLAGTVSIAAPSDIPTNDETVQASAVLDGADLFDAEYFGIAGMEAAAMDPQQRVLLECAHDALEIAGCVPERSGPIGVFVGSGMNPDRLRLLGPALSATDVADRWLTILGNDKDYLASRIAYKLGLQGPSLTVQTACSTSLVAVHLACQSLLLGECDVALAGGATVANSLAPEGYPIEPGDVRSPHGRCRPFDASASGTVFGDGAGVVALKRLADAIADGDHIHATIIGSATNNDGGARVGFSAPGIAGQASVIAEAIAAAGIGADAIAYVEAHGTGTPLGDPVEVAALTRAFRGSTTATGFCALGAVKANIGHASAAAGIAGLVKAALALENGTIPPNPELDVASPAIDLAGSPFIVEAAARPWPRGSEPRIAGISSFGMGGVNAHVVIGEAPLPAGAETAEERPRDELLFLSAKSAVALETLTDRVAAQLASGVPKLAEAAATFATGRRARAHRCIAVAGSTADAAQVLASRDPRRMRSGMATHAALPVVFTIPGSGSQRLGMGATAYAREPVYRAMFDRCADLFTPLIGLDLRDLVLGSAKTEEDAATLARPSIAQPGQFAVSCAVAALWAHWGIKPAALIGHSFGEIVAAHLAGVFNLEDAAALVAMRGRLVESTNAGAMIAVLAPRDAFEPLLGPDAVIACHNGPAAFTIAGPPASIAALDAELTHRGVLCRPLRTDRAFHSPLMNPIVEPYVAFVASLERRAPKIPFVSTVTGRWISKAQAMDPRHWGRQLIDPVRFAEGLTALAASEAGIFLEVGPGRALSTFVEQNLFEREPIAVASLGQPDGSARELNGLLCAAGELWTAGCAVDTAAFRRPGVRKAPMPAHPLRGRRFLLASDTERSEHRRARGTVIAMQPLPRPDVAATFVEAGTDLENAVAAAWRESLGLKSVGIDDDFFELGGHSLIAAGTAQRLSSALDRPVGMADVFRFPTPRRMAAHLAEEAPRLPAFDDFPRAAREQV